MRTICLLLLSCLALASTYSQSNVGIGTIKPAGKLHIAGSSDTTQLVIDAYAAQTIPLVLLRNASGTELLRIHASRGENLFLGYKAGEKTDTNKNGNTFIGSRAGLLNAADYNTATGNAALLNNNSGSSNAAFGAYALYSNTTGNYNAGIGYSASTSNTTGSNNTAVGYSALSSTTTGSQNTALGTSALISNVTGYSNTAVGFQALYSINSYYNNAFGYQALFNAGSGLGNIGIGAQALYNCTSGGYNIGIGYHALYGVTTGSGNIGIGDNYGACSGFGDKNNVIVIGDQSTLCTQNSNYALFGTTNTVWTGGNTTWSTYSDARIKTNVQENVAGLSFIMKLRPVTYQRSNAALARFTGREDKSIEYAEKHDLEKMTFSGFLAQDVEKAAALAGYNFSGITKPKTATDLYSLSYESFVVPLVKAVQEQEAVIEKQNTAIGQLQKQNEAMNARLQRLEELLATNRR